MNAKLIGYWAVTVILALELMVGGIWDLAREPYVVGIIKDLGYPIYLLFILGFWKMLGAIALIVPRFPRLKEWAYAGAFFEMTGAAASLVMRGSSAAQITVPVVFIGITIASWVLRPQDRTLGRFARPSIS